MVKKFAYPKLPCQSGMNGCIDSSKFHPAFKFGGSLGVLGGESLAVTTPWGKELNQPSILAVQNQIFKVTLSQLNHIVFLGEEREREKKYWNENSL